MKVNPVGRSGDMCVTGDEGTGGWVSPEDYQSESSLEVLRQEFQNAQEKYWDAIMEKKQQQSRKHGEAYWAAVAELKEIR